MTEPDWNWGDISTPNTHQTTTAKSRSAAAQNDYYNQNQQPESSPNYFIPTPSNQQQQALSSAQWQQWNSPAAAGMPPQGNMFIPGNVPQNTGFGNDSFAPPNNGGAGAQLSGYSVFPQQLMSDPLFNTARQIGGQFAEQQREKFAQYLSSFQLKYYFTVDTNYVGKKLGIILFPFIHRDWTTKFNQGGEPLTARQDINAPDLYIPLMAFITYVLVAGFVFGLQKRFTPEKLGMLTTNALFYLILENVLVFITKYVLNISQSLNIWHALSYSSYKFVGMVFCLILYLIGGSTVYYIGLAYCIFATVFFLLRSLKTFILDMGYSSDGGRKRKLYLLLSITVLQSLIMWLLTSGVTSYMPDHYDFAKMAMGLAKGGGANLNVPLQPDGEVDYEALLKMP